MSRLIFNVYCVSLHKSVRNSSISIPQWISFWTKIFPSLLVLYSVFFGYTTEIVPLLIAVRSLWYKIPATAMKCCCNPRYEVWLSGVLGNGLFCPHFLARESNSSCFVIGYSSYMCYYSPVMRISFIVLAFCMFAHLFCTSSDLWIACYTSPPFRNMRLL